MGQMETFYCKVFQNVPHEGTLQENVSICPICSRQPPQQNGPYVGLN